MIVSQPAALRQIRSRRALDRLPAGRRVGSRLCILLFALCVLGVVSLQWLAGAYHSDFVGHPDEAAHYVSSLMVHDYFRGGLPAPPLTYAAEYYLHYPKVAVGHWPPGFYVAAAFWMFVFSGARWSIILFVALTTASTAFLLWREAAIRFGLVAGGAAALVFIGSQDVQSMTAMVMSDGLTAVLILAAGLAFSRYLETERLACSIAFGCIASAAILVKGSAFMLALVPPMAVLLTRKWHVLRKASFWIPAGVVVVICAPWYLLTLSIVGGTWPYPSWTGFVLDAAPFYFWTMVGSLGIPLTLAAVAGIAGLVAAPALRSSVAPFWAGQASIVAAVLLFQAVVPCSLESRYVIPAIPSLALLALGGLNLASEQWKPLSLSAKGPILAAALIGLFALSGQLRPAQKHSAGTVQASERILEDPALRQGIVLVSGGASEEGGLIAEMAMRDPDRPSRTVLRATKMLASMTWVGENYRLLFESPAQLQQGLQKMGVGVLVVSAKRPPGFPHHDLLLATLRQNPAQFRLVSQGRQNIYEMRRGLANPASVPTRKRMLNKVNSSLLGRLHNRLTGETQK